MSAWPLPSMKRADRLTTIVQAVCSDLRVYVQLVQLEEGVDGQHIGCAMQVRESLSDPDAEATALHELAHVYLDHDLDPVLPTIPRGSKARGPWELEADALAAAMVDDGALHMTDATASLDNLFKHVDQYR